MLTCLHARYGKSDMKDDLRFREGKPVSGGREVWTEQGPETDALSAAESYFQARYAIRHRWTGPVKPKPAGGGGFAKPPGGAQLMSLSLGAAAAALVLAVVVLARRRRGR